MNSCKPIREMLVFYAEGALETEDVRRVEEHLAHCAVCAGEAAQIGRLRGWLTDPDLFGPTQDLAWQLLPEKLARQAARGQKPWSSLAGFRAPRWALGAAAVALLAAGLIWTLRNPAPPTPAAQTGPVASGNEAFLDKVRIAYAREATAQYLAGCQDLLVNLVSAEKRCEGELLDVSLEVDRARQLLRQKRLLNTELNQPDVARARNLCDDLEYFLQNLSSSEKCETSDSIRNMERYIEKEQLLLRINVVQSGIS